MSKTALVIGGAGFVGFNLCVELQKRNYQVRCLDNNHMDRLLRMQSIDIETFHSDILNGVDAIFKAANGCDVVFELAVVCLPMSFTDPLWCLDVSTRGTYNSILAADKAGADFVYVSSSEVYGQGPVPMLETQLPMPTTIYGAAKYSGEMITQAYARLHNMRSRYLIVRPFNCYGEFSREDKYATVVTNFVKALVDAQSALISGDGDQTRDFMDVNDTVDGLITAYEWRERLRLRPIVNLCTGRETSLNDLWHTCQAAYSRVAALQTLPQLKYQPAREGDVQRMVGDTWYAEKMLEWKSKISLEEGLKNYVAWMLIKHKNKDVDHIPWVTDHDRK